MYSEVVEALLAMGEYTGTRDGFRRESAATIQRLLKCAEEEADYVLQDLMSRNKLAVELTQGGELPPPPTGIPVARWYWYVPSAA